MTEETTITAPTDEQAAAARENASALVASTVADMLELMEGADLMTLRFALEAEQAKGDAARKGAVAALEAAIEGHPELSASAAAATDAQEVTEPAPELSQSEQDDEVVAEAAPAAEAAPEAAEPADEQPEPETVSSADEGNGEVTVTLGVTLSDDGTSLQPKVDGEPYGDPLTLPGLDDEDPGLDTTINTVAETGVQTIEPDATTAPIEDLEDEPADPGAISQAPARPHQSLVDQLDMRFIELKEFVRALSGDVEGELGELLAFVRSKL